MIYMYIHIYIYMCMYIYIHIYIYRERERDIIERDRERILQHMMIVALKEVRKVAVRAPGSVDMRAAQAALLLLD